jgi:hypothetical protein
MMQPLDQTFFAIFGMSCRDTFIENVKNVKKRRPTLVHNAWEFLSNDITNIVWK